MVSTTRPTSCFTLCSRLGWPTAPRKYFDTTTLVASWDQPEGTSTSFCSKITLPLSLEMPAVRSSQRSSSKGWTSAREKARSWRSFGLRRDLRVRRAEPSDDGSGDDEAADMFTPKGTTASTFAEEALPGTSCP